MASPTTPGFAWTGEDMTDECSCHVAGLLMHAERVGDGGWYCSVSEVTGPGAIRYLFHSGDANILPLTGDAARRLCELVVRAELGRRG